MPLRTWFESRRNTKASLLQGSLSNTMSDEEFREHWVQCYHCNENLPKKDVETNQMVCPKCDYHFRISARTRIAQLTDAFEELDATLRPADPLEFFDTEPYPEKCQVAERKSGLPEAVVTGIATADGLQYALGVMDFAYLGGSMGSVVGEKITRLVEYALEKRLSLVIISSSGGARMQEGMFSLMQMVKTGSALAQYHEAGLFYISVLTEPTFGGVTASFGTLGDLLIAEDGARIGFAGRRVIEQTIRQKLPADFQTAGYLKQYGQVDRVVSRLALKDELVGLIRLHEKSIARTGPVSKRAMASAL